MNFYLLSIIAFGVFVAILYLKSSEHQRMLYSQKYVRDKVSGTLGFDKFKEKADEMLQRKKELLALIHLDIDPYHDIVDIYGRETADNVLRILGTELNRRVVKGYLTTRQAGDKFFCLVPFTDEETHNNWFDGLSDMVESEVKRICNVSIKLRGDLYVCRVEDSLEDAMVKTVAQLNKKVFHKCCRSFFIINDFEFTTGYNSLSEEVCSALNNKEFTVYFQPQYNIYTNEIVGAEALLRWEHPTRGIILPEVLIPILEDNNQLSKFENFVFAHYPKEVIRAKGLFWIKNDPQTAYIFEQSGKQKTATDDGKWIACMPKHQQEQILAMNPDIANAWDDEYGDRVNKIVFIGQNMDKEAITKALDACKAD